MADPYNPYTSYSTPTPGGVGYYPPEEQAQLHHQPSYQYQHPYSSSADLQPDPNYGYAPPPNVPSSPYHLTPERTQVGGPERSYTPIGQPDYQGPVTTTGPLPAREGKVPENLGYYGYPADQPRYIPSASPHPPAVHISDADQQHNLSDERDQDADAEEGERGIGSSLAGGAAGYYFGHKKNHGLLGAIGGAIVGNILENKVKDQGRHSHGHHHEHESGHHHHHHHHHHRHSRSRSHSRHRVEDDDY